MFALQRQPSSFFASNAQSLQASIFFTCLYGKATSEFLCRRDAATKADIQRTPCGFVSSFCSKDHEHAGSIDCSRGETTRCLLQAVNSGEELGRSDSDDDSLQWKQHQKPKLGPAFLRRQERRLHQVCKI